MTNVNREHVRTVVVFAAMAAVAYFTSSTLLEIAASVTGLLSVWYAARESIWNYAVGIVNILLFAYIFNDVKLYADVMLQGFFMVLSVYGWIVWSTRRGPRNVRPTTRLSARGWLLLLVAVPLFAVGWGKVMAHYTDASVPYLDALVATLSVAAQLLLSRKVLENWWIWITVDVLSVGMYWYKGLHTISFTYFVFLLICISGLIEWSRHYRFENAPSAQPDLRLGGGI